MLSVAVLRVQTTRLFVHRSMLGGSGDGRTQPSLLYASDDQLYEYIVGLLLPPSL